MKVCSKCKTRKPIYDFNKNRSKKDGLSSQCKLCISKCGRKPRSKQKKFETNLKYRFNLTLEQYDKMYDAQDGVCKICKGVNKDGRRLAVDHDHKTGKIRGLLCVKCNRLLGLAGDSVISLTRAINYLVSNQGEMK
jgi:hypothetical protein